LLRRDHPEWDITAVDNFYRGTIRQIEDITVEHVDIRDRAALEAALEGTDIVLHLAAVSGVDDCDTNPDLAYEVNVTGTNNVAWFCRKTGAGLAFPFSMAVLGDPESFPITVDDARDPLNRYGRTKVLSEQAIEKFAADAFPAHLYLKSNLYGEHVVDDIRVSKGTVINFFVNRALNGEPLTVYEPGTQARNFVHVKDVARAYLHSVERLSDQLDAGTTGVEKYEIASREDPSVMTVAERVREHAADILGTDVEIELVSNPRSGETMVESFEVDISAAEETLGWTPRQTVEESIRTLLKAKHTTA